MKHKSLTAAVSTALYVGSFSTMAMASTSSTPKPPAHSPFYNTEIDVNGQKLTSPKAFAYQNTTYMPIFYVEQGLEKLGFHPTWDGKNWRLTTPASIKPDLSKLSPGKSSMQIYLNGTLVQSVDGIYEKDPSYGDTTTYMPIWYIMQTLKRAGVDCSWDGKKWNMKFSQPVPSSPGSTPPGEVGKGTFIQAFLTTLGIQPDPTGTSPFDDVQTTDDAWGYVNAAIENHLIAADSATHFGLADAVTMGLVDQMYWYAEGIGHADYEPGGAPYAWGNDIGLNVSGLDESQPIATSDIQTIENNILNLARGYRQDSGGTYHIVYPVADEYNTVFPSSSDAQQAMTQTYAFFNQTTVTVQGDSFVAVLPNTLNTQWFVCATTTNDIQYSLDNGSTWLSTISFDTRDLAGQSAAGHILVKAAVGDGLAISYNELDPGVRGTVALGEIALSQGDNGLNVRRGF